MNKSPDAFRTISEVADDLELPQHVLRFWETKFNQIKPMKRGGGRRYYRPDDIDLLRGIKSLLYDEGYTIRGVQRLLKEQGNKFAMEQGRIEDGGSEASFQPAPTVDMPVHVEPQSAISIDELTAKPEKSSKGILSKLTSRGASGQSSDDAMLSAQDRTVLQGTLQELLECKRLLDQIRQD